MCRAVCVCVSVCVCVCVLGRAELSVRAVRAFVRAVHACMRASLRQRRRRCAWAWEAVLLPKPGIVSVPPDFRTPPGTHTLGGHFGVMPEFWRDVVTNRFSGIETNAVGKSNISAQAITIGPQLYRAITIQGHNYILASLRRP